MSNISNLRIAANNVNRMLESSGSAKRLHITRSYNRIRLEIIGDGYEEVRGCIGPKDCLKFAEGMEKALEIIVGW